MHLGATPFSIYNTSSVEQIAYLLGDAGYRVVIVEAAFLGSGAGGDGATPGRCEHLIVLDAERRGAISLGPARAASAAGDSTSRQPGGPSRPATC